MTDKGLRKFRPHNVEKRLGKEDSLLLLNGHTIFSALKNKAVILMACNIRIRHVVPGIMRAAQELDAIVGYELARNEGNLQGGYTGQTPNTFFDMITGYARDAGLSVPFFIHADHTAVRDTGEEEFNTAKEIIDAAIEAGYSSVAIDASHNKMEDNIEISASLGKAVMDAGLGLEVEIGEIKLVREGGALSTVEESLEFIGGLQARGVLPDLLAINNGSKHGNYAKGEKVSIDLDRTKDIYNTVSKYGVSIAQHGITGTPLDTVGEFAEYGIRKGNVGTEWQNIAHRNMPEDLLGKLKEWSRNTGEDIKKATKVFKDEIDNIPDKNRKTTEEEAYQVAKNYITAFRACGTATMLRSELLT